MKHLHKYTGHVYGVCFDDETPKSVSFDVERVAEAIADISSYKIT